LYQELLSEYIVDNLISLRQLGQFLYLNNGSKLFDDFSIAQFDLSFHFGNLLDVFNEIILTFFNELFDLEEICRDK